MSRISVIASSVVVICIIIVFMKSCRYDVYNYNIYERNIYNYNISDCKFYHCNIIITYFRLQVLPLQYYNYNISDCKFYHRNNYNYKLYHHHFQSHELYNHEIYNYSYQITIISVPRLTTLLIEAITPHLPLAQFLLSSSLHQRYPSTTDMSNRVTDIAQAAFIP